MRMCMYSMNAIEAQCWMPLHPPPGSCTNPKTSHQMVTPRIQLLRGCTLGKAANIRHIRAFLKVLPLTDGMRASLTHSTMWVKSNQAQHYENSSTLYLRLNIVRALWKHSGRKSNFSFKIFWQWAQQTADCAGCCQSLTTRSETTRSHPRVTHNAILSDAACVSPLRTTCLYTCISWRTGCCEVTASF